MKNLIIAGILGALTSLFIIWLIVSFTSLITNPS